MFNASRTDLMRGVLNFPLVPDRIAVWRLTSSISPGHGMFRTWQPIYVWRASSLKGWDAVEWQNDSPDKTGEHPTQKPIGLLEKWIAAADAKSVLDLFLGSGSTLIACEKTGRRCFGMEIDPKYCDVVLTRWEQFTGKTAVLEVPVG
jgi:DNA modification methylase